MVEFKIFLSMLASAPVPSEQAANRVKHYYGKHCGDEQPLSTQLDNLVQERLSLSAAFDKP